MSSPLGREGTPHKCRCSTKWSAPSRNVSRLVPSKISPPRSGAGTEEDLLSQDTLLVHRVSDRPVSVRCGDGVEHDRFGRLSALSGVCHVLGPGRSVVGFVFPGFETFLGSERGDDERGGGVGPPPAHPGVEADAQQGGGGGE